MHCAPKQLFHQTGDIGNDLGDLQNEDIGKDLGGFCAQCDDGQLQVLNALKSCGPKSLSTTGWTAEERDAAERREKVQKQMGAHRELTGDLVKQG